MSALVIRDLHVAYGAIRAIRGITFTVEPGQVVALIGANGAGKSTTLNTISGLLRPSTGSIQFLGTAITKLSPDKIVAMGLVQVPEGRQIIAPMTVEENLLMGAYLRNDRDDIRLDLAKMYERFPRLGERRQQRAGLLSGGEQQMLAVSRALMARPKLIMLDEPSMGLAPLLVKQVFEIIETIKHEKTTILLVEQNARKALLVADYAYVLERGEIAIEGPATELNNNARIVQAYLGTST